MEVLAGLAKIGCVLVRKWFSAIGAVSDGGPVLSRINSGQVTACLLNGSNHRSLINKHLLAVSLRVLDNFKSAFGCPPRQGPLRHAILFGSCINRDRIRVGR